MKIAIIAASALIILALSSYLINLQKPMVNIDEKTQQTAISLARTEIQKHKTNYLDYQLADIRSIQGQPDKFFVRFELPNTDDAKIEMIVDIKSAQISGYKDQWS